MTLRADVQSIAWRVRDDASVVRRVNDEDEHVWSSLPGQMHFGEATSGVTVALGDEPAMLLVSQAMRGGAP